MGTKEQTVSAAAASTAAAAATNAINGFDSSTGVAKSEPNDTHSCDSSSNNKSSNTNTNSASTATTSVAAKVRIDLTSTTNEKLQTTKPASATSTLASSHHSKAQVIIIPATPASTVATNAAKKIRRAFSMPRNPFQWSRKFKTSGSSAGIIGGEPGETSGGRGSNSALTACVGGGRSGRNGSIVSLNSYTAVCKDEGGGGDSAAPDAATTQDKKNVTNVGRQQSVGIGGVSGNNIANSGSNGGVGSASTANRVFRRSSLRKFINRIAQHVSTSVNIGANKQASSQANSLSSSDRVPPIGGYQWPADQIPGVTGLKNHGNTCFMNAVLQCLSHTDILAEYFVLDQYKADLKRRNKINSRKFGTKGELTEQLANVLKALWTCKNENDHSTSFKAVVDRYGSQFRSSTQHDAQEFLFWLLDKVHEDLNTATKRRYKSVKNNYGRSDEIIAAETLANHIRCNNSFVQAVFQAQFRSSLTCPRCRKQSNTFDPFHCISVQLPQLQQQTIFVTVLYLKQHPGQVKLGLTVPAGSPIVALREQLHTDTGIASERMVLVDINETGFTRVFYDTQPVSTLAGIETIYCIEVPEHQKKDESTKANETTATSSDSNTAAPTTASATNSSSTNTTDLLLLIANVKKKKKSSTPTDGSVSGGGNFIERFGIPFCLRLPRDCSYVELQKKVLREMSAILKPEVFLYATPLSEMFQIRLQDPSADPDTYLEQVEHPLLTEMIDLALSVLSAEAGPPHIKLLLEWSEPEVYFSDLSNTVVEHESVARLLEKKTNDTAALTLEQCLEHYTKAETLSAEDAWRCPHCQQYLPVVKTLGLWSLPDILVVHFKRFRQHQAKGPNSAKLTTMVKFPLNAFDMSPHLAKGMRDGDGKETFLQNQHVDTFPGSGPNARPSPWKKSRTGDSRSSTLNSNKENRETRYDLYAVCYHQGDTLETGHYTAACKNPYDHQWYKFDDQRVSKVPSDAIEEDIINNEAYMLFYQRRKTDVAECSGSSSTSGEHWVSKIAPPPQSSVTAVSTAVPKYSTVAETEDANTNTASALKPEMPPDANAETKPVEIPKVECVIVKQNLEDIADDVSKLPKRDTLSQMVVIEKKNLTNTVDIDGIEYADDGAEDADVDELDILEQLTPTITGSPTTDEVNQIFVMDEDCKLNNIHYNEKDDNNENYNILPSTTETTKLLVTNGATNSNSTPLKSKSPTIHTAGNAALKSEIQKSSPVPLLATNGTTNHSYSPTTSPIQNTNGIIPAAISPHNSSVSSSTSSLSSRSSPHSLAVSTCGATTLQSKFNGFSASSSSANNYQKETVLLSSSLKSNSSSIIAAAAAAHSNDFLHNRQHYQQQHWHGSRSSVSAVENATSSTHHPQHHTHCLNLRHSFSTSSNYKLKECSDTLSSMLRNSANTCSKDTLIFIDQQQHHHHHHSLMEDDDDTFMDSRSLWISPVTPHKLITVSPKN